MKIDKNSKIRRRKDKRESKYDTFSLTMQLEEPILTEEDIKREKEENKNRKRKKVNGKLKKIAVVVIALIIVATSVWILNSYKPLEYAQQSMESDENVNVVNGNIIEFNPTGEKSDTGIIIYPELKVEAASYAPLARKIAEEGYSVYITDMPLNVPLLSPNRANNIIENEKDIENWVIAAHSFGGIAATKVAENNPKINGIVYMSSYTTSGTIKKKDKKVLSIWGSKDGIIDFESMIKARENFPDDTEYLEIEGGNHSQFGDYGQQKDDEKAVISLEEQLKVTAEGIVSFIENKIK